MTIVSKFKSFSRRKQTLIFLTLTIMVILSVLTWWLVSPLFLPGETIDEDLSKFENVIPQPNSTNSENQANTEFTLLYSGEFVIIDNNHKGSGNIRIVKSITGALTLIFDDVEISNGPLLKVYLSSKSSFSGTGDSAGSYIDLGDLKANLGNFTMEIPSNTEISTFQSVLIWCEPFAVVFTWATLNSA